jgi:hypothetical protein
MKQLANYAESRRSEEQQEKYDVDSENSDVRKTGCVENIYNKGQTYLQMPYNIIQTTYS